MVEHDGSPVGVLFEISIVCLVFCVCGLFCLFLVCFGEFDPGSGRTLAACLTHASRTGFWGSGFLVGVLGVSGERVSNT